MLQAEQLARSAFTLKALLAVRGWIVDMIVRQKWTRTKCTLFLALNYYLFNGFIRQTHVILSNRGASGFGAGVLTEFCFLYALIKGVI